MHKRRLIGFSALLLAVGLAMSGVGRAQDADDEGYLMPESWYFSLGYLALEETDTTFSLSTSDGVLGTTIDYQRDLGGDDATRAGRFRGYYRFNQKHRIDFSTYSVKRDGDRVLSIDIKFGEDEYSADTQIKSSLDTTFYKVAYSYSLYHSKKAEIALLGGLHILKYSIKLSDDAGDSEAADVTAPLPVWGMRTSYGFTPKWILNFWFENFYINLDDKIKGGLVDTAFGIEWRPFKHFGAGFQLVRTTLDASLDSDDYNGDIGDTYRGAELYISTFF